MDFSTRGPQPQKHALGIAIVIALHVIVVYALVTGLGKKIVDVIKQPIETKVIEEIKPPPPPPERLLPPPPKLEAPPPPFIPPPEVQIATPPPVQNVISSTTSTPPPQTDIRPMAPPVKAPPAPAPKPAVVSIKTICSQMVQPEMPRKAIRTGTGGTVVARATIRGGKVVEVEIRSSSPRGLFDDAVKEAMMQYTCSGDHVADQEFVFKLD
ncbi:MAG: energy transducer TonB [Ideonella sp.]|nr:energy transducer TonB [Ideonella sp.]